MNIEAIREKIKGWKTVIFHSLYGVPAGALVVLDIIGRVDIRPILVKIVNVSDIPFVLTCIALGGVALRYYTTTSIGRKE